jgi:hypothetical protein
VLTVRGGGGGYAGGTGPTLVSSLQTAEQFCQAYVLNPLCVSLHA